MATLHISLAPETVTTLFGVPITNSLLTSWLVMVILVVASIAATSNISRIPGRFQSVFEIVLEGLEGLFTSILHGKTAKFFPLLATFFLYILFNNWIGLLPGVGTIGVYKAEAAHEETAAPAEIEKTAEDEHAVPVESRETTETAKKEFVPMFRAGTADLNTTLALALIAVITVQAAGLSSLGGKYVGRFFNFSNPVNFFIGILEIISEFSRILSFSFRLFGNVFAGEVLLVVIAFLAPLLLPLPFIGMEIFVGFIQALVFTMLTTVFLSLATSNEGH